jgi:putative tricarboxylic transport membrane protein
VLVGIWYAVDVLRGDVAEPAADSEDADPTLPADWGVLARLAAVLVVYAFIMKPAGFIIASAVLFSGTAYALGSRHFVRDVPIGVALAIAAWFLFSEWLGIRLPAGLLDGIL